MHNLLYLQLYTSKGTQDFSHILYLYLNESDCQLQELRVRSEKFSYPWCVHLRSLLGHLQSHLPCHCDCHHYERSEECTFSLLVLYPQHWLSVTCLAPPGHCDKSEMNCPIPFSSDKKDIRVKTSCFFFGLMQHVTREP